MSADMLREKAPWARGVDYRSIMHIVFVKVGE